MSAALPGQWSLICVLINGSFIWWAFKLGTFSGWWTGYSYFKLFTFHEVEHKANWFSLGDTNMVQGIQISYKRLDKEENFDGLKVLTLLVGILVKAALFPWWANHWVLSVAAVEVPCGGKHWEAVVTPGRSCRRAGVHIGHNANSGNSGNSGRQEYLLDRDSL